MAEGWHVIGTELVSCKCDWGCSCNCNALPTKGKCEGGWTWHIESGSFGDVKLDGLNFSVYANWPGAIHEGNGEALVLVDERANAAQRTAIDVLLAGKSGGPWQVLGWTWPKVHGPYTTKYELTLEGVKSRMKCGSYVEVEGGPIRNPVTGAEAFPAVSLPQGIIFKSGDLGATRRFLVAGGIQYDHSGQYMAVGPFDYKWP